MINWPKAKSEKIAAFNPNNPGEENGNLFGLPFNFEESELVLIPVPWEVTVSYHSGTALGPKAILGGSLQVDLHDQSLENAWQFGIFLSDISTEWRNENQQLRPKVKEMIRLLEKGESNINSTIAKTIAKVNEASERLNHWVFEQSLALLNTRKLVGIIGGEHSVPLGLIRALATKYESFGILQIDAHMDLRKAYEGFTYSHASIMYNALAIKQVSHLVQIGIRDFSPDEAALVKKIPERISTYTDTDIRQRMFNGESWTNVCREIINRLPSQVYISFDIDGLDPKLCPGTGTPVPGGFELEEVMQLVHLMVEDGIEIIGFDLCEVAPGDSEWNGNVGARTLFRLSNQVLKSNLQSIMDKFK